MRYLLLAGRVCFSLIFIMSGVTHFQAGTIAAGTAAGVPPWLTMASGVIAGVGGLMIAFGWRARAGGALVALFLVPVTLTMHAFWNYTEPMERMMQQINFLKNLSLLGGALAFAYFGSGPLSLDTRRLPRERAEVELRRERGTEALR